MREGGVVGGMLRDGGGRGAEGLSCREGSGHTIISRTFNPNP